jgi:DNA-binding NarL/FixJ family response regulator
MSIDRDMRILHSSGVPTAEHGRILCMLAAGLTEPEIARTNYLSVRTVRRRVKDVMETYGMRTRMQLAAESIRRGWVHRDGSCSCICR